MKTKYEEYKEYEVSSGSKTLVQRKGDQLEVIANGDRILRELKLWTQ